MPFVKGYRLPQETIEKIRQQKIGKKQSAEHIAKRSTAMKGRVLSAETRAKIGAANTGKKRSPEVVAAMVIRNTNRVVSEETRAKMSEAHKGDKHHMYGKTHTEEARIKIGKAGLGRIPWNKGIGGEHSHSWKGDLTNIHHRIRKSPEYAAWRKAVFERDDYTCLVCQVRGGNLQADHIKPFAFFPELRFEISNGRTLCYSCHKNTDTYGRQSYKR